MCALGSGTKVRSSWKQEGVNQNYLSPPATISSFAPSDIFSQQVWTNVSDLNFPGNPEYVISITYEASYADSVYFTINAGNVTLKYANPYVRAMDGTRYYPGTFIEGDEYSFDLFFDAIKPYMCGSETQDANTWFNCTSS